jgi:sulfur carrier protein ThiS
MLFVKVAQLGAQVREVSLKVDATVDDAIDAADVDVAGFEVRLNGAPAEGDEVVRTGDIVTLVPQIKGGRR